VAARRAAGAADRHELGGGWDRSILHGDGADTYLHEVPGTAPMASARNLQIESTYEYGTRAGLWRLLRLFDERAVLISVFATPSMSSTPRAAIGQR
jgi:hypothetical protein